MLCSGKKILIH